MSCTIKLELYRGKVISIDDPSKQGNIQVKLLPEMADISDDKCPWLPPFYGNSSDNELKNNPPQIGSLIWVLADKTFYRRYYMNAKYNIKGKFDYTKISDILGSIDGLDTEYKNIIFELYEDESLSFHNRNDGSHGFISSNGGSLVIKGDSSIEATNEKGSITMDSSGLITINGSSDINVTSSANISVEATSNTTIKANGILTLETGDGTPWQPNIIPNCLFTGSPHGGSVAGITKLKGK